MPKKITTAVATQDAKSFDLAAGMQELGIETDATPNQISALVPQGKSIAGELVAATGAQHHESNLLDQLLGQAQALSAASQLLGTFGISKLAYVKETKAYRNLKGRIFRSGTELSGTWEEFCGLLGISVDKADADIANLRSFGEEALESMSRMGIGYRDLAQYRKIPTDERTALIEAAKSGNKDQLLDLAETLIEKHVREKADASAAIAAQADTINQQQRARKNMDAEIERLTLRAERLEKGKQRLTPFSQRTEDMRAECLALQAEIELAASSLLAHFSSTVLDNLDPQEQVSQIDQLWVAANVCAARLQILLNHMSEVCGSRGIDLPDRIKGVVIMMPDEAAQWLQDYPVLLNEFEGRKVTRQEERDAKRPAKPGRPKGSGNKLAPFDPPFVGRPKGSGNKATEA